MPQAVYGYRTYAQVVGILLGQGYEEHAERPGLFWHDRKACFAEVKRMKNGRYRMREWLP